jgi:hypothetical protein
MAGGLGEAASIAGIIGVVGQTIQATTKLYTFCKVYRSIHKDFELVGEDVECLQYSLIQAERLLPFLCASDCSASLIASLERQ